MEAYTDFAMVYDTFMDETPYEQWCEFLMELFRKYGAQKDDTRQENSAVMDNLRQERNTVLDLGCGTGTLTELLARRGYDMIGVDLSEEMLRIAVDKRERSGLDILYLCQDMRELELYGTVGAAVSVCDSVNYLLEEDDVVQTFRLVNNYLYPEGLFIFDFNTIYKNREECSFIWENTYYEEERINEYDLTIFVREEGDRYRRFQETHLQRGYSLKEMRGMVEAAGLLFVDAIDADTHREVTQESERIYIVARKGCTENTMVSQ